jgi:CheY-like chemotaxis protein
MSATILIIDDDQDIVRILKIGMDSEGYNTVTGYDGQMALNLALTRRPDVIIMDVQMPMTSGLKAMEFLRAKPETRNIPIIFLSGTQSSLVYPAISNAERVAFVKKPLNLEDIISVVRQFLSLYRSAA